MKNIRSYPWYFVTLIALIFLACKEKDIPVFEKMNVVFFLVDDMGWTDVGCYGSTFYETPNIDQFAQEGVKFSNAYAACHVCSPTRASILTGKYPATLQLTDWLPGRQEFPFQKFLNADINQHLPFDETTIAEALKEHGYSTAIFGKWHLGEDPSGPQQHGFDVQVPQQWNKCCPNKGYHAPFGLEGIEDKEGDYLTDRLTDEALRYIESNRDSSFFLYLSHFAVHDPIEGRQDLVKKYEAKRGQLPGRPVESFILEGNPDDEMHLTRGELNSVLQTEVYRQHKVLPGRTVKIKQTQDNVQFAGMVESVDESLGRVLAKLDELDLQDNTIVIFFSDNGGMAAANFGNPNRVVAEDQLDKAYATSNLPLRGAKGWLYEGGIREPLIIRWPGQGMRGTECSVPVISTDFFPTILDMLEIPLPQELRLDGVSIASLVKGGTALNREAIFWHFPHYSNHGMQSPGGAVRGGDYKLLEYFENNGVQLFNLKSDIGEQQDLAQSEPGKVQELKKMLHVWRQSVNAQMMQPNPDYLGD
ncbi:MAG: sulfatase [Saprospiraceae bacterium]|nr:sulfatase [Saprospiraceae bacterium]